MPRIYDPAHRYSYFLALFVHIFKFTNISGAESFADAMKMGMEVYRVLERKIAAAQEIQLPLPVSDNGAFTPLELEEDKEALLLLDESIKEAGYEGRIKIALDMAASAFYKEG